jgi:NADH-quinone oxidoreductase subunit L
VLFGGYFGDSIAMLPQHDVLAEIGAEFQGPLAFVQHGITNVQPPVIYLAAAGVFTAWYFYLRNPELTGQLRSRFAVLHRLLANKYYFDDFNEKVIARGGRAFGDLCWRVGDVTIIDGAVVNGTANAVGRLSGVIRKLQTGYLYHYAFAMVIGLCALMGWLLLGG